MTNGAAACLRPRLHFDDGENSVLASFARMASAVKASTLACPGSRPSGKRLHESSRAVAAVRVVDAQRIARVGELLDAHAAAPGAARCRRCEMFD